ncbi:zinc ribbon domain-containing protein [Embleya sp. NPDC059259]|uniref:zinc ribbon domain-containing protein n=1 Tax=unclassified Embleya TaxID=2699296 RepID=UPI003674D103
MIHCEACGGRMYRHQGDDDRPYAIYYCNPRARGERCGRPAIVRAEWVEQYVNAEFLRIVGPIDRRTITTPGYDPQPEIDATLAEYAALSTREGQQKSKAAKAEWERQMTALDSRLAELEATPARPARVESVPTGRTYADDWQEADTAGRRAMLLEAGAKLTVRKGRRGPKELDTSLLGFSLTGELGPVVEESEALAEAETERPTVPVRSGSRIRIDTPAAAAVPSASGPVNPVERVPVAAWMPL